MGEVKFYNVERLEKFLAVNFSTSNINELIKKIKGKIHKKYNPNVIHCQMLYNEVEFNFNTPAHWKFTEKFIDEEKAKYLNMSKIKFFTININGDEFIE